MQVVPVAGGLIYVRPYYVSVPQNSADVGSVTEYRAVIVSYNDRSVLAPTIAEALEELFPGFEGDLGEEIDQPTEPDENTEPDPTEPDPSEPSEDDTPAALLAQADAVFAEADDALADGDLGLYQSKIDEARQLIADAVTLLDP
jgi:uncharacterized membrane protein (UPF0182 family)